MEPRCYEWHIEKEDGCHWLVGTFSHWNKKDQTFTEIKGSVKLNAVAGEHAWTAEGYFQLCPALDTQWGKPIFGNDTAGPEVWPLPQDHREDAAPAPSVYLPGHGFADEGSPEYLDWWEAALLKAGLSAVEVRC
jgi:hypothetical protein